MKNPLRPLRFLPQGRDNRTLVPWVIAVMIFLCAIGLAAGIGLTHMLVDWSGRLERAVTVQIAVADPDERARQRQQALTLLRSTPGIQSTEPLDEGSVAALLEPWLGTGNVVADLPVPDLIEVNLAPGRRVDMRALRAQLARAAPDAVLDDHGQWLSRMLDLSRLLQIGAGLVVCMLILATAAMVIFGTRAGLASHARTVDIMHLMGAEDEAIAGEFQWQYGVYGLQGGLVGSAAACAFFFSLSALVRDWGAGLLPSLQPSWPILMMIALLPLFSATVTTWTARRTVLLALKAMV